MHDLRGFLTAGNNATDSTSKDTATLPTMKATIEIQLPSFLQTGKINKSFEIPTWTHVFIQWLFQRRDENILSGTGTRNFGTGDQVSFLEDVVFNDSSHLNHFVFTTILQLPTIWSPSPRPKTVDETGRENDFRPFISAGATSHLFDP
jgi:hypothetical protein